MIQKRILRFLGFGVMAACLGTMQPPAAWAQAAKQVAPGLARISLDTQPPDAQQTKEELNGLLEKNPPALREVLALDPSLLGNQAYMATYPALAAYLSAHPEIANNASFYIGAGWGGRNPRDHSERVMDLWTSVLAGFAVFAGFCLAISLLVWLIRTLIDYRRWSRLAKVQTEVHTKLLDRFSANEDLMAYIQSPAGVKFLESSPINLDAGPKSVGAPLSRILWSVQGGVVLVAAGIGLYYVGGHMGGDATQPLRALGILGMALGVGFVISAIISYGISKHLGLIDQTSPAVRNDAPGA